jgi:HlyD family secretion protein
MKKLLAFVFIILVAAGGAWKKPWRDDADPAAPGPAQPKTTKVERGDIRLAVASTGRVASRLDVSIQSKASGEIISLPYDVSDPVEKDALLVEIDPQDEQRNVKLAQVSLASSEARLAQAEERLRVEDLRLANQGKSAQADVKATEIDAADKRQKSERKRSLFQSGMTNQEDYESARTAAAMAEASEARSRAQLELVAIERDALSILRQDVSLARAQVESDRIALEQAERRLRDTKVFAPIAGVVAARTVEPGQIVVSPTNNVSGGTTLLTISDLSRLFIVASVDESDIGKVATGQPVEITADAFPNDRFRGEVVRIATKGQNVSNVVTFEVKIEVTSRNKSKLKPEMTANVEIVAADKTGALLLPSAAIRFRRGERYVLVPEGSAAATRPQEVEPPSREGRERPAPAASEGAAPTPASESVGRPERPAGEGDSGRRERSSSGEGGPRADKPGDKPAEEGVRRWVSIGVDDGVQVEILAGLIEGDEVLLPADTQSRWSRPQGGQGGPGGGGLNARALGRMGGMMRR